MARWGFAFFGSGVRFDSPDAHPTHMRRLTYYLENPFDAPSISLAELLAFSTDNLQRMSANNAGGELTARITATASALGLVQDHLTDDTGALGIRKARKQAKDDFRQNNIPGEVKRIEAGFISAFPAGSPVIQEALPHGRSVFNTCTDDTVESHLETLANAATTHSASLAPAIVTLAGTLLTEWVAIYEASEDSTGEKTTTQESLRAARENLQLMLFLNLNKLGEMFPRQPEKLSLYMQEHLLRDPASPEEPEEPEPPPVEP
ncbi:MAG TPA: hypothetical protein DIT64_22915 [Verrucomicrobiales bacterium]|nr:hypothetical protein [Verrucomicrobiales bacterium]